MWGTEDKEEALLVRCVHFTGSTAGQQRLLSSGTLATFVACMCHFVSQQDSDFIMINSPAGLKEGKKTQSEIRCLLTLTYLTSCCDSTH